MANSFSKEERVAFEDILEGFNDALVLSRNVSVYNTDSTTMERTNNIIYRPQPYVAQSFDGMDQTANFTDYTQLTVPATIGFKKSVPFVLDALELRDALQEGRLGDAAKQKLASDVNVAIMNVAAAQGSLVVTVNTAAGDYDDVALCDSIMNEQGVQNFDRYLALSSRDYNGIAGNIAGGNTGAAAAVSRSFSGTKSNNAFERSYVGMVAGFDTYKMDYANRLLQFTGAAPTISTLVGAANFFTPRATSTAGTGEVQNVDNRFQTITVSSTTGLAVGTPIQIGGVEACHHITKGGTGFAKTFRVVSITNATTCVITPPIISGQGGTPAELQYRNCIVTGNAAATVTRLNTRDAPINCFWQKDALEILPGRYAVPDDAGAAVIRATTDQGIEVVMQKLYDINTMKTKYRLDTLFGVVNKQPEMSGILLFGQV